VKNGSGVFFDCCGTDTPRPRSTHVGPTNQDAHRNLRPFGIRVPVCKRADRGTGSPSSSDIPSRPVISFGIRDLNTIDAFLQLGQTQRVPIEIEYIDALPFVAGSLCAWVPC
jgi:hypothetical protein